ncbi:ras-related protein Rab-18A isoform X1 [Glossina fuscipes]|uniref:Ras-related protein Rab-18A isoform X1 n=1 Tax=Glossina fuscipes TaxID=7396 RepID=A0A9C5Z4L8_9MUSC|nr:ras-related protein Rab-18A isoform X1 [Glossina fuscipes]
MLNDKAIKLLVIGESGVGKSSLIRRFVENKFDEYHDVTIGMDFKSKTMNIDGVDYKLALWDTAGAERFRSLTPSFYRKALGAILVYDITNRESLAKLEAWFTELENYSDNPNIATIVVGNKIDNVRAVSREEGVKFARKHRSLFLETSAKNDEFVADVFRDIVEKIVSSEHFERTHNNNTLNVSEERSLNYRDWSCIVELLFVFDFYDTLYV